MPATNAVEPYFVREPEFNTWLGKTLSEEGTYGGGEGALTEWYNGVHWSTRIRLKSGSPQLTDDLVAEGCSKDRTKARLESERIILTKLRGLINSASLLGAKFKF